MMMWFPVVGTQRRIYADLIRQLRTRSPEDQAAWERYPEETRDLADRASRILIEQLRWSANTILLSDDPADIPFWDKTGDLAAVSAIMALEKAVGLDMGDDFREELSQMTYSQVVQKMTSARKSGSGLPKSSAPE